MTEIDLPVPENAVEEWLLNKLKIAISALDEIGHEIVDGKEVKDETYNGEVANEALRKMVGE